MQLITASYVPEKVVTNEDLAKTVDTSDEWIFSRTGIKRRHISDSETIADMCEKVARKLIAEAEISPLDIDLIICCTVTAEYRSPSASCMVQGRIGAENATCLDVNAACAGFLHGMSVASKFLETGACKKAMVIGAERLSQTVDWTDRATCVLFGDGAGGIIMDTPVLADEMRADGRLWEAITVPAGGYVSMNGREVYNFVVGRVPENIENTLNKANLTLEDITHIIPHQANERIVDALAKKMNVPIEKFFKNISEYGNTSAASIPIALDDMNRQGLLKEGDAVLMTAFGAGMTWGTSIIKL